MTIRRLEERDLAPMLEWMHDRDVTRYLQADFSSMTQDAARAFIENARKQDANSEAWHFAITDDDDEYVGTISLKNIDRKNGNAEYAIVTSKRAHGKGLARRASEEILAVGFDELGLERIYLCVTTDNVPANKLYQRLGFAEEGVWKRHLLIDGAFHDLRWYGLLKEDYRTPQ